MVFGSSFLHIQGPYDFALNFEAKEALKCINHDAAPCVSLKAAKLWEQKSGIEELTRVRAYDWTFSCPYEGSCNIEFSHSKVGINYELLMKEEAILFYDEILLFEDELADNGMSTLTVKIVKKSF